MKLLVASFALFSWLFNPVWFTDVNKAKEEAVQTGRPILISFSGSDWCVPCIRMHKEIFEAEPFTKYAENNLVLVNADFPRSKKHQLSAAQQQLNNALADRYNPKGIFPYTILIDPTGKVLNQWEGYPDESAEKFVAELNSIKSNGNH
ncbi:thioredoxin family protein [Flavisolibacter tropicus]|uniref:Thiol-disulfide isomerase n=1 Tax=Flavisolibacter tropicus TaxID=1492898 RepID=A0A172TUM6_9BACT|nr:thioredoxin family protein [Flavisolibacter tropicus]ANE50795.1 thiol-disulfide isomerase [Flavisolibacter tropicus]